MDDLVRILGNGGLVGDDDHRVVALLAEAFQQIANDLAVGGIKIAGRFIRKEKRSVGIRREVDEEGPRDGGALLLTAGKRVRIMVAAMAKLKAFKELRSD